MTTETGVTVIVPTLNRGGFLVNCVADLLAQSHRPLEILIVDQSDQLDPALVAIAAEHPDVISHYRVGFRGLPRARNYGWQLARHESIVFVDDDIRCGTELVSEHLRALSLPGVGIVAGGIDSPYGSKDLRRRPGVYRRWTATPLRGFALQGEGEADHAPGCNFSAKRSALAISGGFDEALGIGAALYEELEICLRIKNAGFRVYFNGAARLTHLTAPEGGCRVSRVRSYVDSLAHNRGVMIRRHGRWYHTPFAVMRLAALGFSYARSYREPAALFDCVAGGVRGYIAGGRTPLCTVHGGGDLS